MMNLTFKHFEIFRAVIAAGAISKATGVTGLSQPTISQQLAKFEEEIGMQLIYRRRSGAVELTPAGDFWHRAADDILRRRDEALAQYNALFRNDQMVLRFGTTHSLRGSVTEVAARIAVEQLGFSRFEFMSAGNSDEIVQKIDTHQLNCGIVSASSVEHLSHTLHVMPLFRDRIVWAVPRALSSAAIAGALDEAGRGRTLPRSHAALTRWVEVNNVVPWQKRTSEWYQAHLPEAQPYFSATTHQESVDFVAAGLATCHCPASLVLNLGEQVRKRVTFYDLGDFSREAVFIMPKHLMSLKVFADFATAISGFVHEQFRTIGENLTLLPMPQPELLSSQSAQNLAKT